MTHEAPQVPQNETIYPRTAETYPQPGMFNVAAMPDDYIAMVGRSIDREQLRMGVEGAKSSIEEDVAVSELMAHLGADIAHMVMTNPERGRALMSRLAQSDDVHDRNTAGSAAVALGLRGDYEFARGILLGNYERDRSGTRYGSLADSYLEELEEMLAPVRPDLAGDLRSRGEDVDRRWFGRDPDEQI